MTELTARAEPVRGNIVLFESRFDQRLADNGDAGDAYRQAGLYRFTGPSAAAKLGAVAALVRSIGGADFRLPHTGLTLFTEGQAPIPAAALAAEDADLVTRLAESGPVTLTLLLTPRTLPDADSDNVIADWPGREKPNEYVIVSGHLDSWDLATGATDGGVGVIGAAAVIEILKELNLRPRRSVRFIAWTNEENGSYSRPAYPALRRGSTRGITSITTTPRPTPSTRSIRKISGARSPPWPCSPISSRNCPSRCPDSRPPIDRRLKLTPVTASLLT